MEKIQILIVEDDPIIAADLQDRLEEIGYGVLGPVAAGEDAPSYFEQSPAPDLVIMDVQLEGEWDGIETTRRIRQQHDLPVIFLTSNSDAATFKKAKAVNPQAFLSKPFRGRDLVHTIELAIRQSVKTAPAEETTAEPDNSFLLNDRLFIKMKERMVRLFFKDIQWVEADDYYCKVHTQGKSFLVSKTLKKFSEDLLLRPEFMRVHRSYIVNIHHIEEIGEIYIHIGKKQIPLSKNMREELLAKLKV